MPRHDQQWLRKDSRPSWWQRHGHGGTPTGPHRETADIIEDCGTIYLTRRPAFYDARDWRHETQLVDAEQVAPLLKITVKAYRATSLPELQATLAAIASDGMNGLVNFQGGLSLQHRQLIADFATQHRLPAVYQATMFADAGGLMAWAPDLTEQYRVAADYVDQILKGANPGDLPIRYPARYFWTVNQTAAKAIGLTLSPSVLGQVDRVIS